MTDPSTEPATTLSERQRAGLVATVTLALFLSAVAMTIVATALESIRHELGTSVAWAGWTITGFSLGQVLLLSLAGQLTDRFGSRRVFLTAISIFVVASLLCGFAPTIHVLIVLRVVQGLGAAGITPAATRIIVDHYGPGRDKVMGLFGTLYTSGAVFGPVVGGALVVHWSWRWVFFVTAPIGAALVVFATRFVPADPERPAAAGGRLAGLDLPGAGAIGIGLAAGMVALSLVGDSASEWAVLIAVCALVSVGGLVVFARHIHRVANPLIEPRLITGKGFAAVNTVNILYSGCAMGLMTLVPLYAATRYRFDLFSSGLLLATEGAASLVVSFVVAERLRRTGFHLPLYGSGVCIMLGMVGLAIPPTGLPPFAWLAISAACVGVGLGLASPATRNAGLQLLPDASASIAAVRSTGVQVGSIVAVSVATAVVASVPNATLGHAWVYAGFAVLVIAFGPLATRRVPEHRGSW